eukprot:m.275381 g.275381  ORF g.275381 m.275381 type:complete len:798 (-) comp54851_c0_seq7:62-2455(-)
MHHWRTALLVLVAAVYGRPHCDDPQNAVVRENCLPGNPQTEWDINAAGDPQLQGFATQMSAQPGETVVFKIDTVSDNYRLDIYRVGYYQGNGARRVDTIKPFAELPQVQPACYRENDTFLVDCANWEPSAAWQIPDTAVSGVYFARLVREDAIPPRVIGANWRTDYSQKPADPKFAKPGGDINVPQPDPHAYGALGYGTYRHKLKEPRASHIYFVVRDDKSTSDIVFQTSDTTWQAYNRYGGTCMYGSYDPSNPMPRSKKASYNRPFVTRDYRATNMLFNAEYPTIRFLERNGYDVSYISGLDTHRFGKTILPNHRLFLSVGHDEYWSAQQRRYVERARDRFKLNLAFFSGNEVFWKIRFEDTPHRQGEAEHLDRVMVCYKESQELEKIDPKRDMWTGTFRDSRPINPEGAYPENSLTGTIFTVNAWRNDPLLVPYQYSKLRFWRNSKVAKLQEGETAVLLNGLLGHEFDEDLDNGYRPSGLIRLSETHVDNVMYIQDHGGTYDTGSATHHLVMYRASSGALVFGAGTVQWGWGLDQNHDNANGIISQDANSYSGRIGIDLAGPDVSVQQATVNLFADMQIQPASLDLSLTRASPSNDTKAPTCRILAPERDPSSLHVNLEAKELTILVEARDKKGGRVASVEVSVNHGLSWHPAQRSAAHNLAAGVWAYHWVSDPKVHSTVLEIRCRAVDDSLNLGENLEPRTALVTRDKNAPAPKRKRPPAGFREFGNEDDSIEYAEELPPTVTPGPVEEAPPLPRFESPPDHDELTPEGIFRAEDYVAQTFRDEDLEAHDPADL